MTTKEQHLQTIREAVIKASGGTYQMICPCENCERMHIAPIRLSNVLAAIDKVTKEDSYFIDSNGGFHERSAHDGGLGLRTVARWNLNMDDIELQGPHLLTFLATLLAVKE